MYLSEVRIRDVIDFLWSEYSDVDSVFAIDSEDDCESGLTRFVVRSTSPLVETDRHETLCLPDGASVEVRLAFVTASGVREAIFDPSVDHEPVLDPTTVEDVGVLTTPIGGARIRRRGDEPWGTLGIIVRSADFEYGNQRCRGEDVLISNNHVIAANDSGRRGDDIEVHANGGWRTFADLRCFLRVNARDPYDLALATVRNVDREAYGRIRRIGDIARVARPARNTTVKKYGARTGYTTGDCRGSSSIRLNGRRYWCWRVSGSGFACPGDSGSAVVHSRNLVGFVFAVDDAPDCDDIDNAYFLSWDDVTARDDGGVMVVVSRGVDELE